MVSSVVSFSIDLRFSVIMMLWLCLVVDVLCVLNSMVNVVIVSVN